MDLKKIVRALIDVARKAYTAADDSEDDGTDTIKMPRAEYKELCDALEVLDQLPDDKPGVVMTGPARAEWALRGLLDDHPLQARQDALHPGYVTHTGSQVHPSMALPHKTLEQHAATTASASGVDLTDYSQPVVYSNNAGRAQAPSHEAAALPIKTWQERYAELAANLNTPPNELRAERRKSACRDAEIADLRAALAGCEVAPLDERAQAQAAFDRRFARDSHFGWKPFDYWSAAWDARAALAQPAAPADPLDWPLPCDVEVGPTTILKGCQLRVLVQVAQTQHQRAVEALAAPAVEYDLDNMGAAVAAIQFALEDDDGLEFLRYWNEGEFDVLRRNWPGVPEAVFIGADPLHPATKAAQAAAAAPADDREGFDAMDRDDWRKLAELRDVLEIECEVPATAFQFATLRIKRLYRERDEARAEAARATSDAARLDWMIAEECQVERTSHLPGAHFKVCWPLADERQSVWFSNPRDAIDDAMRTAKATAPAAGTTVAPYPILPPADLQADTMDHAQLQALGKQVEDASAQAAQSDVRNAALEEAAKLTVSMTIHPDRNADFVDGVNFGITAYRQSIRALKRTPADDSQPAAGQEGGEA
jgi:hypothetical protein